MARLTPETVKMLARELYDYDLSDDAAPSVTHLVGATVANSRRLESLELGGLQPPFGYPTLIAEANRIGSRK
ncbi:MAG TPA: hypothetical protein VJ718_07130 [Candidatus Binataceae bacterium]|nr:hypothetical protein [Candidatus Binataceae bacterium]